MPGFNGLLYFMPHRNSLNMLFTCHLLVPYIAWFMGFLSHSSVKDESSGLPMQLRDETWKHSLHVTYNILTSAVIIMTCFHCFDFYFRFRGLCFNLVIVFAWAIVMPIFKQHKHASFITFSTMLRKFDLPFKD